MTSSSTTTHDQSYKMNSFCNGGSGKCGNWSGLNIVAVVLGFIFLGPLGLVFLFWVLAGRDVKEIPEAIRHLWVKMKSAFNRESGFGHSSDNAVFNEYQQTQHDRIHEIKEEIKSRAQHFQDFRDRAKRRADEEEFNQFMSDGPDNGQS